MPLRHMGGGSVEGQFDFFLTLALDRDEWLASHAGCFSPWGRCTYYCTKGWVGSTASGYFGVEKYLLNMSGIDPQYRFHIHHLSYQKCPQALHVSKLHFSGKKVA